MRFHVPALPHTRTPHQYSGEAYTTKTDNFCRMMMSLGHEVFHYGAESGPPYTEHVQVISPAEQAFFFDADHGFKWDADAPYWRLTNRRIAAAVAEREQRGDFLCLIGGVCQKPIADLLGEANTMAVEIGIGYYGTFSKYRMFESYTHQALVYGQASSDPTPSLYDAVVPGYFDVEKFPYISRPKGYVLYVGRIIHRKGIRIAVDAAREAGMPLIIAGRGGSVKDGILTTEDGADIPLTSDVTYLGHVSNEDRCRLMGEAQAVLMPTLYMECFGNVAIEAQLCGTPVITTDHGAFAETIIPGVNGFRCHTLKQFVVAIEASRLLPRPRIREIAESRYSLERISRIYEEHFNALSALWEEGWPAMDTPSNPDYLTVPRVAYV